MCRKLSKHRLADENLATVEYFAEVLGAGQGLFAQGDEMQRGRPQPPIPRGSKPDVLES